MPKNYVLKNAKIFPVTSKPIKGDIVIKENKIEEINTKKSRTSKTGKKLDMANKAIFPGLINTHTHSSMTLLRGIADDLSLKNWLEKIRPIESKMGREDVYAGAQLACLEMIKNGITSFSDMYFHMEEVVKAVKEIGMRADLGFGMVTIDKEEKDIEKELEQGKRFYKKHKDQELIDTFLAPHSISTCSIDFLKEIQEIEEARIQMHVSETKEEFEETKNKHGKTPVKLLRDINLLDKKFLATHCVHVTQDDIGILKEKEVSVSHNPNSNMKLASGIAPISEMLKRDINICLGTDGAASNNSLDLIQEMKNATLLQKVSTQNPSSMTAEEALKMATINAAKAIGKENRIGSIEEGKKADLIAIDLNDASINPKNDIISNLVYSGNSSLIDSVFVNGELVVHEKELKTKNETNIIQKASNHIKNLKEDL